ncbi:MULTISPECIES: B12-binding domain-containing radical SAM protein [unclassified Adlercreutzia]|uniref:B12-binding domain-containing radical SAM protein n=1 Tax=unclassified Adlercreutzia TaxID=2636013 RepID=UPI0013EA490F|nr:MULTISPECIES: radical SAM protein [unclassified Adlercreutzia]
MDLVLINPHVVDASTFPSGEFFSCTAPNMGIAYIAAAVEAVGRSVRIIDANALHLSLDELHDAVRRLDPDVVGVTATTTTLMDAFDAVRAARRACPGALLALGGIHASRFPRETLAECAELDLVCVGEGEETFVELLDAIEGGARDFAGVRGLAFRDGEGAIVLTPERPCIQDLDALPFPARHLLPMELYASGGHPHRTASIVSSRGCPFGCKFCAAPFIGGSRYRKRSAESILDEIGEIVEKFHMNSFEFVDDLFTLDKRRVMDICDGIVERGYEVNWTCSARADTVSPEMLRAMAGAGCRIVYYGIESGSQRILDLVGKRETLAQMADAVRWTHEASMRSWGFFIIGFPSETAEEIERTIAFASEINLDYAEFFICSAFPGSPLYEHAVEQDLVRKDTWADISYGKYNIESAHVTPQEMHEYLIRAYRSFYTSDAAIRRLRAYGQEDLVEEIMRQTSDEFLRAAREGAGD